MKIAFITTEYVTEAEFDGGLANYLYRVAIALSSLGHVVEIFTLSDHDGETFHDGIRVHRVVNRSAFFSLLNRGTRYRLKRTLRFLSLAYCLHRRMMRRMRRCSFDAIQAASCFGCGLFATLNGRVPVVTRVSSFEPLFRLHYHRPLTLDQRLCELIESLAIKRSDAVYAPSRFLATLLQEQGRIAVDVLRPPFRLHPGSEDDEIYRQVAAGRKYFLFYGSIGFLKGCETIAKTLPHLLAAYPDMNFVFAGKVMGGPGNMDMAQYIRMRADSHIQRVIFTGALRHQALYPLIRYAHAVVLPSLVDNLPNTMLEAMAFAKVVIGTRGTSFEEYLQEGVTGFLVPADDPESLSKTMEMVWQMDSSELNRIGIQAKVALKELAPDVACGNLIRYLERAIDLDCKMTQAG